MTRTTTHPGHGAQRGFTLMEIVVVLIVLTIIAALTVPRVVGSHRRAFDLAVDQTEDLLMMFAQRDNLARRPIALWHDVGGDRNTLMLLVLDKPEGDPEAPTDWQRDAYSLPVPLPSVIPPENVEVFVNGDRQDITAWPLVNHPGHERPAIEVVLRSDVSAATVYLPSYATAPRRIESDRDVQAIRLPYDLDAAGRNREDW